MEYEQLNLFDEPQEVEKWATERKEDDLKELQGMIGDRLKELSQ